MIKECIKNYISDNLQTDEIDLYLNLKKYLTDQGFLEIQHLPLLLRYCKLQKQFFDLIKDNPKHYMLDKYAGHLADLEEQLCLTPKSMLKYKKDKVLINKNIKKMSNG